MKALVVPKIPVLLETTIQIHRIVDEPEIKKKINEELANKIVYTTTFVVREFLRTIIGDIRFVWSKVNSAKEVGVTDGRLALSRLSQILAQGIGNFSPRAAQRQYYVVAAIQESFSFDAEIGELISFLEMTSDQWLEEFFEVPISDNITDIRETCLCSLDEPPDEIRRWIDEHRPIPGPPPFPKLAASFLQLRRGEVKEIEESFQRQKHKYKDARLLDVLVSVKTKAGEYDFENKLRAQRGWALGDLLIALETPSRTEIYTTDRHYDVICGAIGRRRYPGYLPRQSPVRGPE